MAGLPGTGKSALARALAARLEAPILDKDRVRDALFGPRWVDYSREQDDLVGRALFEAARHLARRGLPWAILDGRTYVRADARAELRAFADELGAPLLLVECVCPRDVALERIERDRGRHRAANRDAALYARLAADAEPFEEPKLTLDTSRAAPEELAEGVVRAATSAGSAGSPRST